MFWDRGILCHDNGWYTTGFWNQSNGQNFRAFFQGEMLGDFPDLKSAQDAIEEQFRINEVRKK